MQIDCIAIYAMHSNSFSFAALPLPFPFPLDRNRLKRMHIAFSTWIRELFEPVSGIYIDPILIFSQCMSNIHKGICNEFNHIIMGSGKTKLAATVMTDLICRKMFRIIVGMALKCRWQITGKNSDTKQFFVCHNWQFNLLATDSGNTHSHHSKSHRISFIKIKIETRQLFGRHTHMLPYARPANMKCVLLCHDHD